MSACMMTVLCSDITPAGVNKSQVRCQSHEITIHDNNGITVQSTERETPSAVFRLANRPQSSGLRTPCRRPVEAKRLVPETFRPPAHVLPGSLTQRPVPLRQRRISAFASQTVVIVVLAVLEAV